MITDPRNQNLSKGKQLDGFIVENVLELTRLDNIMYILRHTETGARLIHLSNEDNNNCFSVAFRTTPTDSTGVAHILEHTALCGSELYPVRDPFFSMIRRSMKTFMNAFTASDWTMYPFSTQNKKDYYNLMSVYLDAAFFPELKEINFKQEGHRLEFAEEGNKNSDLVIKGIVYNEMKGAMSSQHSIMHRRIGSALFPTITYKHNSGGEPRDIPNLTWQQFKDFHSIHYHPSNAYFFTYGDLPLKEHTALINKQVLSRFSKIDPGTEVADEIRYKEPQNFDFKYPLNVEEDDGKKSQLALSWLTCGIKEPIEALSMHLIEHILLGNSSSPLRKKLVESKLGKSLCDCCGYESETKETYFTAGLQGIKAEDADKVEALILDTLNEIVNQGIETDRIETALHQIELDTREISGGHYPYSLNLLFRFFGAWVHDGNPVEAIDFDKNIEKIKQKIAEGSYLENQIKKYLIDNPHRVKLLLTPDHEMEEKEAIKLSTELAELKVALTEEQKDQIIKDAAELKEFQEQEEDLSCLPTLSVSDIPTKLKKIYPFKVKEERTKFTFFDQPTNGIDYLTFKFKMESIQEEDRKWFPLMSYVLTKLGTKGYTYDQMASEVSHYTGGFGAAPSIQVDLFDDSKTTDSFRISGKALGRNLDKFFELATRFIINWDFSDHKRLKSLIDERANHLQNSVVEAGHTYALSLAQRKFSWSNKVDEIYGGVHQVQFMRELAELSESDMSKIEDTFNRLVKSIFNRDNLSILAVGSKERLDQIEKLVDILAGKLPSVPNKENKPTVTKLKTEFVQEAWTATTPVSYVAKSFKTAGYTNPDNPKLTVLTQLLQACFLHGEIREKGGAYGAMATFNPEDGIFSMLSYRDPHLGRTIDVFEKAYDWILSGEITKKNIEEAILQCCSKLDTPLAPADRAAAEYNALQKGKTQEMREKYRAEILNCTKEDIIRVAKKWLTRQASIATVTSSDMLKNDAHLKYELRERKI